MKWISHITIAASICAVSRPELTPIAILGSTAPDWLEFVLKKLGRYIRHRTTTHYVSTWLLGMLFAQLLWDFHEIIFWFTFGGFSHVIADSLTVAGVPMGWWSDRKIHLFGGRIRTGQIEEYFVSGGIVICAALAGWTFHGGETDFIPFFYQWGELYNQGIVDGIEWKINRFKFL